MGMYVEYKKTNERQYGSWSFDACRPMSAYVAKSTQHNLNSVIEISRDAPIYWLLKFISQFFFINLKPLANQL